MTAPVLLVFYSPTRLPESEQMARDLATVAEEYEGRFLAGLVDIDVSPAIAQAVQLPSVPFVFAVLDGRPAPLIQDVLTLDDLRGAINQVMQQLTTQGMTARHQPRSPAPAAAEGDDAEPVVDPRYARGRRTRSAANDFDGAVAEYEKLVDANPADTEAAAGLAMAKVLQRTAGVDVDAARAAADAAPDDVAAQTLVADLDLLGGRRRRGVRAGWSSWSAGRRATTATRPASTCSGCSPRSATTTRGCSRAASAGQRAVLTVRRVPVRQSATRGGWAVSLPHAGWPTRRPVGVGPALRVERPTRPSRVRPSRRS